MSSQEKMAILQLTIIPIGTKTCSVGHYVAAIQTKLSDMGVPFVLNDTGTVIEGDAGRLLKIIGSIYETPFDQGAVRVVTQITIDDRRDKEVKIGDKIQSVINRTSAHTLT
jgi:uncharacterized protein (TIGR00106 family)